MRLSLNIGSVPKVTENTFSTKLKRKLAFAVTVERLSLMPKKKKKHRHRYVIEIPFGSGFSFTAVNLKEICICGKVKNG